MEPLCGKFTFRSESSLQKGPSMRTRDGTIKKSQRKLSWWSSSCTKFKSRISPLINNQTISINNMEQIRLVITKKKRSFNRNRSSCWMLGRWLSSLGFKNCSWRQDLSTNLIMEKTSLKLISKNCCNCYDGSTIMVPWKYLVAKKKIFQQPDWNYSLASWSS